LRQNQTERWQQGVAARVKALQQFADELDRHRGPIIAALTQNPGRWGLSNMELDGRAG
jgi:hypothetical protein